MLKIEIVEAKETEKTVLRQLCELYEYDFSEYEGTDVNEHGFYGFKYFDHYWTEAGRHPFLIKVDSKLAGFVFVSDYRYVAEDPGTRSISEFFIMRKYRRKGIGKSVARQVFEKYRGKWEVFQHHKNEPAKLFWEAVISEYANGNYRKFEDVKMDWGAGQVLSFDNSIAMT